MHKLKARWSTQTYRDSPTFKRNFQANTLGERERERDCSKTWARIFIEYICLKLYQALSFGALAKRRIYLILVYFPSKTDRHLFIYFCIYLFVANWRKCWKCRRIRAASRFALLWLLLLLPFELLLFFVLPQFIVFIIVAVPVVVVAAVLLANCDCM